MSQSAEGLKRVEARLTRLQAELADMAEHGEDHSYMLGWAEHGIKAALADISVWKEA